MADLLTKKLLYPTPNVVRAPHNLPTAATAQVVKVPDEWKGRVVAFAAQGGDAFLRFGADNTVTINSGTVDTIAPDGTLTAAGNAPHVWVPSGTESRIRVPRNARFMAYLAAGTLRATVIND